MTKNEPVEGNERLDDGIATALAEITRDKCREAVLSAMLKRLPPMEDNKELVESYHKLVAELIAATSTGFDKRELPFGAAGYMHGLGGHITHHMRQLIQQFMRKSAAAVAALHVECEEKGLDEPTPEMFAKLAQLVDKELDSTITEVVCEVSVAFAAAYIFGRTHGKVQPGTVNVDMLSPPSARAYKLQARSAMSPKVAEESHSLQFMPEEQVKEVLAQLEKHEARWVKEGPPKLGLMPALGMDLGALLAMLGLHEHVEKPKEDESEE